MSPPPSERYPDVEQHPSFPQLERSVIERWQHEDTFAKSVDQRSPDDEFVFYDGPPFANGLPHYGHLLTGFVKDAVPRYRTMRGQRVERRFGWDCHGLPVEMQAEQELGLSGRVAIEAYGVDKFNERCRSIVGTTAHVWRDYVTRQARWVDMDHDYKTMDLSYMESVMWAQKQLYDKGLLYEGYRVLPYCWECETPLSNFETRLDDAYRDRQDPAVTVWFELDDGRRLLVWTTTPWTLAVEPRDRGRSRHRLRRVRGERASSTSSARPGRPRTNVSSPTRHRWRRSRAPSSSATATRRCSTSSPTNRTRSWSSEATSSPPRTAPASSTWRPASARTTSAPAKRQASRSSRPSIRKAGSRTK